METQLLREQDIPPTKEVLEKALGNSYAAFEELTTTVTSSDFGLTLEWNYYKDGKSWLCKVCHKKKTIFWLSVWDGFFKTNFIFTEKNLSGIAELDIAKGIKEDFCRSKPVGRLIPLLISITKKSQLKDVLQIAAYKKSLK